MFTEELAEKELSEADKMFLKLGYKIINENNAEVRYRCKERLLGDRFEFILIISKISKNIFHMDGIEGRCCGIGYDLLQAINKKVEELGFGK